MLCTSRWTALTLTLLLTAACEGRRDDGGGGGPSARDAGMNPNNPAQACGNGEVNGLEACDGEAFAMGRGCDVYGLGTGNVSCTSDCKLSFASCSFADYCTANNAYTNMTCDACQLLGGVRDPECMTACGANGMCADKFDRSVGVWTCRALGMTDPDCGMCGNGIVDASELCDGNSFPMGQHTCESYGYLRGSLRCKNDCTPSFAECQLPRCGDGMIEGGEECEGTNLQGASCTSKGFAGGELRCNPTTCKYDQSQCVAPGCGNGIVEAGTEECDGQMLGGQTCVSQGFAAGELRCNAACSYDTSACVSPGCGNGVIEMNEQCEGMALGGQTCMSQGFAGGTLRCSSSSCTYDTSMCVAPGCGNMIIEPGTMEQCEGANLNGQTCQGLGMGFTAGTLACDANCRFDAAGCVRPGCGNGVIEAPELCDGTNFNNQTCQSLGFVTGTLACDANCRFVIDNCLGARNVCGDGRKNGLEACDGTDLGALSPMCSANGLGTGTVRCTGDCRIDLSGCSSSDLCAAANWYSDGQCDACHLLGGTTDPDCAMQCPSNGVCASYFDTNTGGYTCPAAGRTDPDCTCGNGTVENGELCDGNAFNMNFDSCTDLGFASGTVSCDQGCVVNFDLCF